MTRYINLGAVLVLSIACLEKIGNSEEGAAEPSYEVPQNRMKENSTNRIRLSSRDGESARLNVTNGPYILHVL